MSLKKRKNTIIIIISIYEKTDEKSFTQGTYLIQITTISYFPKS